MTRCTVREASSSWAFSSAADGGGGARIGVRKARRYEFEMSPTSSEHFGGMELWMCWSIEVDDELMFTHSNYEF